MALIEELFIQAKTRAGFNSSLAAGDVQDTSIAFIEDTQEIWAKGKFYPCPYTKEEIDTKLSQGTGAVTELRTELLGLLDGKVDKVEGKGLSTNDYTTADKDKLDGIEEGAQVNTVTSVAGKTGAVTLEKGDVGLGNVDNTSDIDKPVSTATQTELDKKVDKVTGKSLVSDSEITKLEGLDDKDTIDEAIADAKKAGTDAQAALDEHKVNTNPGEMHIPAGGSKGDFLRYLSDGKAQWAEPADAFPGLEDLLTYGVEFDTTISNPALTRIGNPLLHKSLPIQSQLKGCISQGTEVMYWLNPSDWRFRKDPIMQSVTLSITDLVYTIVADVFSTKQYNKQYIKIQDVVVLIDSIDTTTTTATLKVTEELTALALEAGTIEVELGSVRNGYDGVVRVHSPRFYGKSGDSGDTGRWVRVSTARIDSSWVEVPEMLIDAYRSTRLREVPADMGYLSTLPANSLISVANTEPYCRGLENQTSLDANVDTAPFNTALGKPIVTTTRANARTYAKNAGSELLCYEYYKWIFYWLWVIEYANFNSQAAYNPELTSDGYRQGGMGPGVTENKSEPNVSYGLVPCGYCDHLGNGTGVVDVTLSNGTTVIHIPRWRGFDNNFGDIWTNLDGYISVGKGNDPNEVYTTTVAEDYGDDNTALSKMKLTGLHSVPTGWYKEFDLQETAEIIPKTGGGSATTYMCDYNYKGTGNGTKYTLIVGGCADYSSYAGVGRFYSGHDVGASWTTVGFRSLNVIQPK